MLYDRSLFRYDKKNYYISNSYKFYFKLNVYVDTVAENKLADAFTLLFLNSQIFIRLIIHRNTTSSVFVYLTTNSYHCQSGILLKL